MLAPSPFEKGGQGGFVLQIADGATLMQRLIRIKPRINKNLITAEN
jgi:hypothetical protein